MSSGGTSPNDYGRATNLDEVPKRRGQSYQGRSSRDLDEEIIRLRNDNFNLKLRLHFKEQVNEGTGRAHSSEATAKELQDAKAMMCTLRTELAEKTQLLKDAADAITEHEERQREFVLESQARIAELEGYLAHFKCTLAERQRTENVAEKASQTQLEPPSNPLIDELKRAEEKASRQDAALQNALRRIATLKEELEEKDNEVMAYSTRLQRVTSENAGMMCLLQKQYKFSVMANKMMDMQKSELEKLQAEKQELLKKMDDLLPELSSQNALLKEAAVTVRELLDKTEQKDDFSRDMISNYKAAIIESKAEVHKITDDINRWNRTHIHYCSSESNGEQNESYCEQSESYGEQSESNADHSLNNSLMNSDSISQDLTGCYDNSKPQFSASVSQVEEREQQHQQQQNQIQQPERVSETEQRLSSKDRSSSTKHLRGQAKSSFTGLRQFVKCWGRQYQK